MSLGVLGHPWHGPNWTTIHETSPLAAQGVGGIHNAAAYNSTLSSHVDLVPPATQDDLSEYFIGDQSAYGYQNTYYSWNED